MLEYFHNVPFSVTVCDKDGKILEMNETAERVLSHGKHIIGQNLLDCHPEPARTKLVEMLKNHNLNAYTIEKNLRMASLQGILNYQWKSRWKCRIMCGYRNRRDARPCVSTCNVTIHKSLITEK